MPVVTIGENTADDFAGATNAEIRSDAATTNYGQQNYGYLWGSGDYRFLIVFSGLSNISSPVTVNSSTIYVYAHITTATGPTISGRPLLVPFVQGETTYNIRSTGNNWTTAGASSDGNDRRATVSFTNTAGGGLSAEYASFTDAQLYSDIEDFIDGTLDNYGFIFQGSADGNYLQHAQFLDGERPYISVDYTAGSVGVSTGTYYRTLLQGH